LGSAEQAQQLPRRADRLAKNGVVPEIALDREAVEVAEAGIDLEADCGLQEAAEIQVLNVRGVVLENVVVRGREQVKPFVTSRPDAVTR
jgi:hypothetical protein